LKIKSGKFFAEDSLEDLVKNVFDECESFETNFPVTKSARKEANPVIQHKPISFHSLISSRNSEDWSRLQKNNERKSNLLLK